MYTYFLNFLKFFLVFMQCLLRQLENLSSAAIVVAATNNRAHWRNIWSAATVIWRVWTIRTPGTPRQHEVRELYAQLIEQIVNP